MGLGSLALAGLAGSSLTPSAFAQTGSDVREYGRKAKHDFGPLPDFKFELEKSKGWVGKAGSAKEATTEELPISKSIAGVSMRLTAGGLRELHWHAIAGEWAYVVEGRMRTTIYAPGARAGQGDVVDFGPGDVWFFPKGHGHSLQGITDCHFILGFDDGNFSEFGTFSLTDWITQTPPEIVAQNLKIPVSEVKNFKFKGETYISQGVVPSEVLTQPRGADSLETNQQWHKFNMGAQAPHKFEGGELIVVSQKEFPIQNTLTAAKLTIRPGGLRELHWHPGADEWQYILNGEAEIGIFAAHGRSKRMNFSKGDVAFIDQGFGHYVKNTGNKDLEILALFNNPVYGELSLSGLMAATPTQVIADNLFLTKDEVGKMVKFEQGFVL
jgi:oxalate decarboxylase